MKKKISLEENTKADNLSSSFPFHKELKMEIVSDLDKCFSLFEEFSTKKNLFETWEFRYAFYKGYNYKPHFILLKEKNANVALLPLWYDATKEKYTWFGSDWVEEVGFFAKDKDLIPFLVSIAPTPLLLNAIRKEEVDLLKDKIPFTDDDAKYVLNLKGFKNHEDFLMTLKKNRRHDLRKDRRKIERRNPKVIINRFSDLKTLIKISEKRFKGDTDWEDQRRTETFKHIIKLGDDKSYKARMITVKIGTRIAGVDINAIYKDTYFTLKCGYDVEDFPGIGNFINLFEIDDAIKMGLKKIDFLQNSYAWKNKFFESVPLYKYEKD